MLELFQLPLSKQQRVSSNSRTIAKRNLSLSSFSSLKKKKLPFPRFFHRLLPRHVASPSFVSSSLLPALSPALYVSLCLSPPLDPRVIGVDALEGDSRYGLKRMTKLSKWKGADLVTSSYIFPRLFPIDHRFNSMKNEQVSLSLSLCLVTFQEVNPKGFIFLSFCLRWQSISSWLLSSPSYVTRCHESSYTSFLLPIGILSNKHRISCYTPRCPRIFHKLYCFREFA